MQLISQVGLSISCWKKTNMYEKKYTRRKIDIAFWAGIKKGSKGGARAHSQEAKNTHSHPMVYQENILGYTDVSQRNRCHCQFKSLFHSHCHWHCLSGLWRKENWMRWGGNLKQPNAQKGFPSTQHPSTAPL